MGKMDFSGITRSRRNFIAGGRPDNAKEGYLFLKIAVFFVLIAQVIWNWAIDPTKSITQYVHDVWKTEQGLPQNSIEAIIQSRQGYLWLGTQEGIVRFDGVRFDVFDKNRISALKENYILSLFEDADGALWVGTFGGGLTYINLQEERFFSYTTADGLGSNFVYAVNMDRKGTMWIGTTGGVSSFKDGKFATYTTHEGLANNFVYSICINSKDELWLGTLGGGASHLSNGKFTNFSKKEGLTDNFVRAILPDRQGNLWLGTENGLNMMKDGKFSVYTTRNGLSDNNINSLYEDHEGSLWVGTNNGGLNRIFDGKISAFPMKEGLSKNTVFSILEDHEGSLWIGTGSGGLNRLKDGKIITFTTSDGLADDLILSVYEDDEDKIWIGTENGGLSQYANGNFKNFPLSDNKASNKVQTILKDKKRNLWFGTGNGLYDMKDGKLIHYTANEGLPNNSVTSLCEAVDGSLWVGTRNGLGLLKSGKFSVYQTEQGLSNNVIKAILLDRQVNLWVGTNNGLNRLQNGVFRIYTTHDGLSNNFILSIYEDKEGILWIGTRSGLNRLAAGKITSYSVTTGMYDDLVFQILEDEKENLWMSCNKGIYEISKNELNQYALGKIPQIHSISYGIADGMKSRECCGGLQPSGWKSHDGRLWFPTIKGLTVINPALSIKKNETQPPVIIEQVWVEGREVRIKQGMEMILPPGTEKFEFHYTALSFLAAEKVRFKYQLQGIDRQVLDAGKQRAAYYTKIPPGHYTFKVTACNSDGVWNTNGDVFKFYLKPFFYQTWWFYLICGIGCVFMVVAILRFRTNKLEKREKELEQLVVQRTEQLANANKELQRLSIVASKTDNAVFIMNAQGNLEWINEGCVRMHGLPGVSMEQLIQKLGTNLLAASSNPDIKNIFNSAIKEKRSVQYESYLKNAAGEIKWLQTTLTPIFDDAGNLSKLVAIDSDIGKIKAAEEALMAARRDAEQANHAKSEFLSRMSHELRTPMNSILGFAQLMESDERDPLTTSHQESLHHILKGGRHLLSLINEVLDLARIESGRLMLSTEPMLVAPMVSETVSMIQPLAKARRIRITNAVPAVPAYRILTDPNRVRQVLLNLLSNAVKYNREEGLVTVEAAERPNGRLRLSVTDTGPGIPLHQQELVFEPFQRLGADRMPIEGSGIGLTISRKLTEAMGGTLSLTSTPGLGSCFFIDLPMSLETSQAQSSAILDSPATTPAASGKEHTVLYIEDDLANLALVQHIMVRRPDIKLLFAPQGDLGLELARVHRPDLILLDIHLPDINGHEVCRRLKEDPATRSIPVLIVSASAMPAEIDSMIQAGAASYLTKPLDVPLFLNTIDTFLIHPPEKAL
ncbi:MAG: ATP-binding protein [Candidatus Aminicenantes bacterium]|nr:ATP-binding protein [Candidatus Aminicenantes bacterium]